MAIKSFDTQVTGEYQTISSLPKQSITRDCDSHELLVSINSFGKDDNNFSSAHTSIEGSILNGNYNGVRWWEYPTNFYTLSVVPKAHPETVAALGTRLYAGTNPSRPMIHLPVFWAELKDIPGMLRQGGRMLFAIARRESPRKLIRADKRSQDLASLNLAVQFGWMPFLQDLKKIITLHDSVERRRQEIERLRTGRGLKRTYKLGEITSEVGPTSRAIWSGGGLTLNRSHTIRYTNRAWGTCRWKPTSPSTLPQSNSELRRIMSGMTISHIPENLWEALPWSWLIDYFTNIGDVLAAGNRTVATPVGGCIMRQGIAEARHDGNSYGNPVTAFVTAGKKTVWTNRRDVIGPNASLSASFPTLGARQLSVLGSLAILRARRL